MGTHKIDAVIKKCMQLAKEEAGEKVHLHFDSYKNLGGKDPYIIIMFEDNGETCESCGGWNSYGGDWLVDKKWFRSFETEKVKKYVKDCLGSRGISAIEWKETGLFTRQFPLKDFIREEMKDFIKEEK